MNINQKRSVSFSPPDIGENEIKEVIDTLCSGWITTGPKTKKFEQKVAEYIGVEKAVCLNSATSCMELTLRILGIGPGDEVITSAYTYTASAAVIHHVGAKIVLVDVAPDSYEMDYSKLEEAITQNTKAIIPVDLAGCMCDYDKIFQVVERKKSLFQANNELQKKLGRVTVIADAAHSFGALRNGVSSGKASDFTCFSFHAVKNLTTAEGGAVVWRNDIGLNNDELYQQFMLYSLHGQSKDALAKTQKGSWEYDIVYPGFKCNMTDISAGIGLAQLERYEALINKRRELINWYEQALSSLNIATLKHSGDDFKSSGHLYLVRLLGISEEKRNEIIVAMADAGVATNVHYKPLPLFTAYKNLGFSIEEYPNAFNMYENEITLPLHTLLEKEDVEYVCRCLKDAVEKVIA